MKIWFMIGADQGNEQDGPQPPERYSSAHSTVRFLDPFTLLALTKAGNICEGSQFSRASLLQAHPVAPTPLLSRKHRPKSNAKLAESEQFSEKSNRNWPKNRRGTIYITTLVFGDFGKGVGDVAGYGVSHLSANRTGAGGVESFVVGADTAGMASFGSLASR
jgi:hypothetical protein